MSKLKKAHANQELLQANNDKANCTKNNVKVKLDAALAYITDGFFIIDEAWNVSYANHPVLSYFSTQGFVGKNILCDFPRVGKLLRGLLRAKTRQVPVRCDAHIEFADTWVELNIHPLPEGELAVYARDISKEKKQQALLEEKFEIAFQSGTVLMAISTVDEGRYLDVNRTFSEVLGYTRQEAIGKTSLELGLFSNPQDRVRVRELYEDLGRVVNFAIDIRDKAGGIHSGLFSVEGIRSQDQACWLTSMVDITREKRLQETLEDANRALQLKVDVDGLTGLYNHAFLMNALEKEMERSSRYGSPLSVVMLDIDKFKKFNDSYGHLVGDDVLKGMAEMLQFGLRNIDIAGRYGGEEFMLILPNTGRAGALNVAERLRMEIAKATFTPAGLKITISAGVAEMSGEKLGELIRVADERMYDAKRNGRNRVEG
ncbi:MAG TPA: sensor domain-containing diguanylate cyclase [Negativicutes bacterium]|nr:sensor domain-containing diguanylate cyclase [Negativicutes bacterium]